MVLVGEGLDEFNLGYYHYTPGFKRDKNVVNTVEDMRHCCGGRHKKRNTLHYASTFLSAKDFEAAIPFDLDEYYNACPSTNPMEQMEYYYAKKFLKYRLDANDRCAMAHLRWRHACHFATMKWCVRAWLCHRL